MKLDKLRCVKPTILVVGDLMLDHYLWGKCERISPEAPVQVVEIERESTLLGGAGNVVNNILSLGANVSILSVVGDDENGDKLFGILKTLGANVNGIVVENGRKTSKKSRVVASYQQVVRFDSESKEAIKANSVDRLLFVFEEQVKNADIVLISDYAKGVLTPYFTSAMIRIANALNKPILIDPKGEDYSKYSGATLITPNKKEASIASRIEISDEQSLQKAGFFLKEKLGLDCIVVTLSEDGIAIFDDKYEKMPTVAKDVYDVTGAGDTVFASLGFALSCGLDLKEAAFFANAAAAVVVSKFGSATATLSEIEQYLRQTQGGSIADKIKTRTELLELLGVQKEKKIVFTNGCFDILHVGHAKCLEVAKSFGDMLIVGINSDSSIKRLKGQMRPINTLEDRAFIVASLGCVSYVVPFEEDTPLELISAIKPDVLVKGSDYAGKEVVGSAVAKEVRLVEVIEGKSTTEIIKKVQAQC